MQPTIIDFAANDEKLEFVCAAGILAHYIGDACQPLHISQFHHGRNPSDKAHAKVHSVYETTMIGRHGRDLIGMISEAATSNVPEIVPGGKPTGRDAAAAVVELMQRTVKRLAPLTIVDLFDENMGRGQVEALWAKLKTPTAACMQDGAKTLARVWEAAWRAGSGETRAQGGEFSQDKLRKLYMDPKFLPAYPLQEVTLSPDDRIIPISGSVGPARGSRAIASTSRATTGSGGRTRIGGGRPAKKKRVKRRTR
jgi:hypothetical protein